MSSSAQVRPQADFRRLRLAVTILAVLLAAAVTLTTFLAVNRDEATGQLGPSVGSTVQLDPAGAAGPACWKPRVPC